MDGADNGSLLERLTDFTPDFGLMSLIALLAAVLIGVLANHFWFRARLEPAVDRGTSPRNVRLESFALALALGAAVVGVFSGWGFLWAAVALILAMVIAFASGARLVVGVALLVLLAVAALTAFGLRPGAL
ncbi:glucan phosphoethanolaminetransferase (alkaline phosphatase superfamily) [Caulobacter ginsengisoli]|uniref:Glucan phosphoethanolaminetransferase (Alkaline phosphatase superfamily) n=1 Tax=Caulobacter ginsengisoli TaxID=400775 RepID=A0ABU0IUN9_9CAUL|nr:hypothetical protein [Caulobacter ginsengisoli]MDQ0465732.1 glucan phosphoethanolaminetransferase (alkaline phosphatase superfamily) [Caulobacter ginsengisoli]